MGSLLQIMGKKNREADKNDPKKGENGQNSRYQ